MSASGHVETICCFLGALCGDVIARGIVTRRRQLSNLRRRDSSPERASRSTVNCGVRAPVDHRPTNVSGTGGVKSRRTVFRFCTKKIMRFVAAALIWNLA
jgi:hypothetical protein